MKKILFVSILILMLTVSIFPAVVIEFGDPVNPDYVVSDKVVTISRIEVNDKGNLFWFTIKLTTGEELVSQTWTSWEGAWEGRKKFSHQVVLGSKAYT